ncbi:leucine-rich repeat (LRR) family protein [Artemisia annua]|uniref:Leucine-rich repeat (LRR) family protein n=1 Tax=Artemisia annua TaxID=35608 RepID=A0A2U1NCI3_ARTAN|nr:leucine-rich repeat (LRR) family protein [Artemisia annua]
MTIFFSILTTILLIPTCLSFTVIMSDAGVPSALVDAPQTGFSVNNNGAKTDPEEQQAVYDIMKATGNEWATEIPDVCRGRWHGIECMPDKNNVFHVVSLSFGALSDDTAFPTCDPTRSYISHSITKLPHIRTLFFYRCFSDKPQPIPTFLGQLGPTLQTLVLRENGHVGPIPIGLGNLTGLRVLDLHKNNLNGSIPVSINRFTGLKSLDLSSNKLTGSIPSLNFPQLTILDLNQNHLTGSIPPTIGNCISLMKMDISRNRLSGQIPDSINGLTSLILIDLSYNSLSGPLPLGLKGLDSLQALILNGNPMGSMIPNTAFDNLKNLMILILSDTYLHGPIPESIARLPNLRILHLDRNRLNGSIPTSYRNLNGLSELRLNDNELIGPIPFGKEMIWKMRKKLKLQNNLGLCYDGRNGLGDDLGLLSDSDIGHCDMPKPGPAQMVQHLATSNEGEPVRATKLIANSAVSYSLGIIQLVMYLVMCFI